MTSIATVSTPVIGCVVPVHEPAQRRQEPGIHAVVQLESDPELVRYVLLRVVRGDVVHLPVEVEGEDVSHAGVHREIGEGEVGRGLRGTEVGVRITFRGWSCQ